MRKNRDKKIDLICETRRLGNWNFRNKELPSINTKPIGVTILDQDVFVWNHDEILKLIEFYHEIDEESIKMIEDKNIDTGDVNFAEISFLDKIENKIKELKNENTN